MSRLSVLGADLIYEGQRLIFALNMAKRCDETRFLLDDLSAYLSLYSLILTQLNSP